MVNFYEMRTLIGCVRQVTPTYRLGMFSVNRFSINRTETENGGQDGKMQNAVMYITVHQYRIVKR